jgi:hypothetical protein
MCCFNTFAENTHEFRLSEFYGGNAILRLHGGSANGDMGIPLSPLVKVTSAKLHLEAISSIALLKQRSVLNVRFNNATIGQIAYDPSRPEFTADIDIPTSLWRNEYNILTLAASHYADVCQAPKAPDLWSEVNLFESSIKINTQYVVDDLSLQALSSFFHPGVGSQRSVKLFTIDSDTDEDDVKRQSLPVIAQGLALREQYQTLEFEHISQSSKYSDEGLSERLETEEAIDRYRHSSWYLGRKSNHDLHVLVATRDALQGFLPATIISEIKGPFLKIQKTPSVRIGNNTIVAAQNRLIVSGLTADDVAQASAVLAYMDDSLNPDDQINILGEQNATSSFQSKVTLQPGEAYSFRRMGNGDSTFFGAGTFSKKVEVRLPADYYVAESANVKLALNFGYGAGFGAGSILNILVNGEIIHGLSLEEINGRSYREYLLSIPARYFSGGVNQIEFSVNQATVPQIGECASASGEYLRFYLSGDSTISIPESVFIAKQPDLKLLAETGYPFARFTRSEDTNIYISQQDMLSSALTIAGKIAQSAGNLVPSIQIVSGVPEVLSNNALVLAQPEDLSEDLFSNVSTSITKVKKWPYRLQNELFNRVSGDAYNAYLRKQGAMEFTLEESSLGEMAVLVGSKNPTAQESGTLFFIVADSTPILSERISELVQGPLWGQLSGDFFAWDNSETPQIIMQVSRTYEVGQADTISEIKAWLSNNPWYWLVVVFLLVLLASFITYTLVKNRNEKLKEQW